MTRDDDWHAVVVQLGGNSPEAAMADLFAAGLPEVLGREAWFAVPTAGRTIEVAHQSGDLVGMLAVFDRQGCVVRAAGTPAVLDPSRFPDGEVWPGFARLLCNATIAAGEPLARRRTQYPVLHPDMDTLVRDMATRAAPDAMEDVLDAAAAWLGRVGARRRGAEPRPAPPTPAHVVAGARAVHVHVLQLCGVATSSRRLDDEIELICRARRTATE